MLSFSEWLVFAVTGRVLIYLWSIFPLPTAFELRQTYFYKTINKLHKCDLCAGFWIYSILAIAIDLDMYGIHNIVTYLSTGAITTLVVHLFVIGWKEKFQPAIIV